ncbi:hypothetical protein NP233_g8755 [Leucocoprinus birnbaumii]|uniref:Uncharacterized protein n=1 Tax=Leucocoprinus birnbaumii TaxID=56174 RepID=A0AAD5YTJ5_9AGAR|nr:hypothetical protein NP233_g8755 [Leucocoprinus birnbaumii]
MPEHLKKPQKLPNWTQALRHGLGVGEDMNNEIMKLVGPLVSTHLNLGVTFGKQKSEHVSYICTQIQRAHPTLKGYEDNWVSKLIMKTYKGSVVRPENQIEYRNSQLPFMSLLTQSFTAVGGPLQLAVGFARENIKKTLNALCPCSSSHKRKASSDFAHCEKPKRIKVDPMIKPKRALLGEFPAKLMSLICDELDDGDLIALMFASKTFIPSASETFRSRLEEKGIIQHFLGSTKITLSMDLDDNFIALLTEFLCMPRVTIDFDFWALIHLNQTTTLLEDNRCIPATDNLWKALGSRVLENVELVCDDRDPPYRSEEGAYEPVTPVLRASAPIQIHYLELSTAFTQPCCNAMFQPLLRNCFPSILCIHVHQRYRSFGWRTTRLDSLFALWITSDHHIRIDPSFYKSHPRLSSITTVTPFSCLSHTPRSPSRCKLAVANVVQPDLRRLSTSPHIGWKLGKVCALESLEITAREPWDFDEFLDGYHANSAGFCQKVNAMTAVFRGIPASRISETRVEFELPRGVAEHCLALQTERDWDCACFLGAKGVDTLVSVRLQVDDLSEVVYSFIAKLLREFKGVRDVQVSGNTCNTTVDQERIFILGLKENLSVVETVKTHHGTWIMGDAPYLT